MEKRWGTLALAALVIGVAVVTSGCLGGGEAKTIAIACGKISGTSNFKCTVHPNTDPGVDFSKVGVEVKRSDGTVVGSLGAGIDLSSGTASLTGLAPPLNTTPGTSYLKDTGDGTFGINDELYLTKDSSSATLVGLIVRMSGGGAEGEATLQESSSGGSIKIGVILPLTGSLSSIAEVIKTGIDLAASDVNANNGIDGKRVNLVYKDDKLDAPTGTTVYEELIADGVKGIVGPIPSTITLQVILKNDGKSEANRVVIVSPASTATELSGKSQYFFRTIPSDAIQGPDTASVIVNTLGKKSVGLLYQNDIYGNGLRQEFTSKLTSLGGSIAAEEAFPIGQTSFSLQVSKILSANPDIVYIPGFYKEQSLAIKEFRSQGYTGDIVASEAIENEDIFQIGGSALDKVLFMKASVDSTREPYTRFVTNYTAKYGISPGAYSDYGYDALLVIVETLRAKGLETSPTVLKDHLHQTTFTNTVTREIQFDQNGDLVGGSYAIYQINCDNPQCSSGKFLPYP